MQTELGPNVVHVLILPNLKAYSAVLEPALSSKNTNPQKREEAHRVYQALLVGVYRPHTKNSQFYCQFPS